ncbi:MAG: hypothetical protein MR902_04505 [Campylobacter sp.]|nr:hypothetical protein [Campylobacter sp.]
MHRILIVLLLITGLLNLYYISKNKSLVKKIDSLKNEILILENKNALCKAYLEKQNLAIEKLKLDIKQKAPPKSIEKIKKSRLKMRVVKKNLGLIGLC